MAFANTNSTIGNQPVSFFNDPDATQRHTLGRQIDGMDPYWGGATFIYLKAGEAIDMGELNVWDKDFNATNVPNTANTGRPVAAAMYPMASGDYGWFCVDGEVPVAVTASVAAGTTVGLTGAGTVGAVTSGKQILNAVSSLASTGTVAKANTTTVSGSNILRLSIPADGWFYGIALSGTGIAASTTVTGISEDGRTVTMNNNATASGSVTVTGTYTGFIKLQMMHPFVQGQVT